MSTTGRKPRSAAPTPWPRMVASRIPVSTIRSAPCFAWSPSKTRLTSPSFPTSSPRMTMRGSRRLVSRAELRGDRRQIDSRFALGRVDRYEGAAAVGVDRRQICLVRTFADPLDLAAIGALVTSERVVIDELLPQHPFAHPADRIEVRLEAQALGGLVALVRTARRVALRLSHFGHVHDRGNVLVPRALDGDLVYVAACEVVVTLDGVEIYPAAAVGPLEALQHRGDGALRGLQRVRDGDAVAVVPDRDHERDREHAGGIEAFPERPLARAGIADRREAHLVAVAREAARDTGERRRSIELGRPRQSDRARHLRADR